MDVLITVLKLNLDAHMNALKALYYESSLNARSKIWDSVENKSILKITMCSIKNSKARKNTICVIFKSGCTDWNSGHFSNRRSRKSYGPQDTTYTVSLFNRFLIPQFRGGLGFETRNENYYENQGVWSKLLFQNGVCVAQTKHQFCYSDGYKINGLNV